MSDDSSSPPSGKSSTLSAAVNLAKLCIGTGVLALPFAVSQGGLLFSPLFIGMVAWWNEISCHRMMACKQAMVRLGLVYPPGLSSTYTRIAYVGAGRFGVFLADVSVIMTLLGVCIAYLITFTVLLETVPWLDLDAVSITLLGAAIVFPLCCANDVGFLARFSLFGLICLVLGVASILSYGLWTFLPQSARHPFTSPATTLVLFPQSLANLSTFIGISVFCFGLCSIAFPVEESMRYKSDFPQAVRWSLIFVWSIYVLIGVLGALLYLHDDANGGIQENILVNLPEHSIVAFFVRISMALVCVLTFPLTFVPPAEMISSILWQAARSINNYFDRRPYQRIPSLTSMDCEDVVVYAAQWHTDERSQVWGRYFLRLLLLAMCTLVAIYVPCFALMIAVLGGFTVSILSFVLPPWLHLNIVTMPKISSLQFESRTVDPDVISQYYMDWLLIILGVLLTVFATSVTAITAITHVSNHSSC